MRRRSRSTCTSSAFRPGAPPGQPARASCSRLTTVPNRARSDSMSRASTGGSATHAFSKRSTPSWSSSGTRWLCSISRALSVSTRVAMSASSAGTRIQSSRQSVMVGGEVPADTSKSRARPSASCCRRLRVGSRCDRQGPHADDLPRQDRDQRARRGRQDRRHGRGHRARHRKGDRWRCLRAGGRVAPRARPQGPDLQRIGRRRGRPSGRRARHRIGGGG